VIVFLSFFRKLEGCAEMMISNYCCAACVTDASERAMFVVFCMQKKIIVVICIVVALAILALVIGLAVGLKFA